MPNTPRIALPYPNASDSPNGAAQITSLATALDTYLGAVPRAQVYPTADMNFTSNGQIQPMAMLGQEILTNGMSVSNGNRLVVPTTGVYRVSAQARITQTTPAAGTFTLRVAVNPAGVGTAGATAAATYETSDATNISLVTAVRFITLTAGDHLQVFITGLNAAVINLGNGVSFLSCEMTR
jgi:hypothetical protein